MENSIEDFLTAEEEQIVVNAIRQAEANTSGEIRVHLERCCDNESSKRTQEVFWILKMNNTKLKNAVLIYIALHDNTFAIYGDKGINDVVSNDFWESTKNTIQEYFKKGLFTEGLVQGILQIGKQLKQHFPWSNDDINELSDSISKS
jgi:uncharacterized membrane protein